MQRIERYGVIALVFLLVTIVAVSLWGEREKTDGVFSFLDRDSKTARIEELLAEASSEPVGEQARPRGLADDGAPLSEGAWQPVGGSAYRGPETPPTDFDEYLIPGSTSSIAPETLDSRIDYTPQPEVVAQPRTETLPPPAAKPAVAREYTIRSGDTLSQIAMRELGTKDRWRELVEFNPGLDPARLHVGTKLRLPGGAVAGAAAPREAPETRVARAEPVPSAKQNGSKVR